MKVRRPWTGALLGAAVLASGCASDDYAPETHPKTYAFEGKADPRFVGTWTSEGGNSTIQLDKRGSVKITTVDHSVKGKTVEEVSGKWLADADSLMFRYAVGSQPAVVVKYKDSLAGNTMVLQQPGFRVKTTYHRK